MLASLRAGQPQHIIAYGTSLTAGAEWVEQLRRILNARFPGLVTMTNTPNIAAALLE